MANKDTRDLNIEFNLGSISKYLEEYSSSVLRAVNLVDKRNLESACRIMKIARDMELKVFVAGNGGSASICNHLECDWQKGTARLGRKPLMTRSLVANVSLLTAIANDISYDDIFVRQLELMGAKEGEPVILISSSGNSKNIVRAAEYAKELRLIVVGMTGFTGGRLKEISDISLHVPFSNYGVVEDSHQMLMHVLAQYHDLSQKRP